MVLSHCTGLSENLASVCMRLLRPKRSTKTVKAMTTSCRKAGERATRRSTVDTASRNSIPAVNCSVTEAKMAPPTKMRANRATCHGRSWPATPPGEEGPAGGAGPSASVLLLLLLLAAAGGGWSLLPFAAGWYPPPLPPPAAAAPLLLRATTHLLLLLLKPWGWG